MRRLLIIAILLIWAAACDSSKTPRHLISQEDLVPILVDFHMVYSIQSTQMFRTFSREYDTIDTYSFIFDKHGVDKALFDSTIAWFSAHPTRFTEVYDEVVMVLTQRSDSLNYGDRE